MWILGLLLLVAIAYAANWLAQVLPPPVIAGICGGLLAIGWLGLSTNLIDSGKTSNTLRILRHVSATLFLAAVPMSCSTVNYMSVDPKVDVLGFEKSSPRGKLNNSSYKAQTRGQRRAKMIENLPGNILWLIQFLISPHGLLSLAGAFVGALPFIILFRQERQRESPEYWLRGNFWFLTVIVTVFFLIVFNRS